MPTPLQPSSARHSGPLAAGLHRPNRQLDTGPTGRAPTGPAWAGPDGSPLNRRGFLRWSGLLTVGGLAGQRLPRAVAAETGRPPSTPELRRVLLVTGVDYPGHLWRQTAPVLADLLWKDQRLGVTVIEDPHLLDSAAVPTYHAIVLHFMNWEVPSPGEAARANLRRFVEQGGGLVLVHFACGAWQDWPEFRQLAGRVYDPKLPGHDPRGPFRVNITGVSHPVTAGLTDFEADDELYTCLAGERPVQVLATARSKITQKDEPMAFVFGYGQGRVFHSPLGHDVRAFRGPPVAELFRRGCAWAAGLAPVSLSLSSSSG
ncbi:MAG: ThuA domain-containing protein [Verrucomicrobia bacterium]|nr:ThuA domain-containing protein [Verrucomicrobiota bacterium]